MDGLTAISTNEMNFGKTNMMTFHIQLEEGAKPFQDRVRLLNPNHEQDPHRQIDEWLEAGLIKLSNSALVLCRKKCTT